MPVVLREGIEPPPLASSGRRSTSELPKRLEGRESVSTVVSSLPSHIRSKKIKYSSLLHRLLSPSAAKGL